MQAAAGYESQGGVECACAHGTAQPQRAVQAHRKAAHSIVFVPTMQLINSTVFF